MNTISLEQTSTHLARQVRRWDRRLRLVTSALWGPRGLIAGLVAGISVALVSRLRPWLLPEQVAWIAIVATLLSGTAALIVIWAWPRSTEQSARYFDNRFELSERVSTALELSAGVIPFPERLAEYQLSDAVGAARRVNTVSRLPVRIRFWEVLTLVLLAALLGYLLIKDNPKARELQAQRDLQNAIDTQAATLDDAIEAIESDESLTPEEKEALTQPLEEARDILSQPDISQQEAVAAMAQAEQSLKELSDGMMSSQEAAYQQAADQLADSDATSNLAQSLNKPDLGEAASDMQDLADAVGQGEQTQAEQQALANQLDQAADALEQANPALAQKLREAAQALRSGDEQAAQQALSEAADLMQEQQQQLENSPLSDAAQSAAQQVDEGQRELAQTGQEQQTQNQQGQQQSQPGQQGQQEQQGQQGQQSRQDQTGQQGQQGQQSQSGEADQQSQQGQSSQQSQQGQTGQDEQSGQAGQAGQEGQSGSDESTSAGASQSQSSSSNQPGEGGQTGAAQGSVQSQQSGSGAGEGEGGAGIDTTSGLPSTGSQGEISTNNSPSDGGLQEYNPENAPSTIGGQSDQTLDIGALGNPNGLPVQEGEFSPNPSGESMLSYTDVYSDYQGAVSDALESGRIPLDQRDVIHDYFSSLER